MKKKKWDRPVFWGTYKIKSENLCEENLSPCTFFDRFVSILESGGRKEVRMARKRFTPEQIVAMLREVDVSLSQSEDVRSICRSLGITEQTYYRWRKDYGGMKVSQVRRLKELEREYGCLKEALEGKY